MNLGKKVKVRDMKPGWTYRVPGKTLEEIYESAHEYAKWPPVQMTDAKQNTGLLLLKVTEDNKTIGMKNTGSIYILYMKKLS